MIQSRRIWLYLGFVAGLVAVGIPYWIVPYRQVSLPGSLLTPPSLTVVVAVVALVVGFSCSLGGAVPRTIGAMLRAPHPVERGS